MTDRALTNVDQVVDPAYVSTDGGSASGPNVHIDRESGSAADNDFGGKLKFRMFNDAQVKKVISSIGVKLEDASSGSEDGHLAIATSIAGANQDRIIIGNGVYTPLATGGDQGADTINTGQFLENGNPLPVGCDMKFGTGLATVAAAGTAVKLVSTTSQRGDANGFTVGTDNTITATFLGTKLCHFRGIFFTDIASGTDNVTYHIYINSVSAFETLANSIATTVDELMELNVLLNVTAGDVIELFAENEDEIVNITTAAYSDRINTGEQHGFLQIHS